MRTRLTLWVSFVFLALAVLLLNMSGTASAQDATPQLATPLPSPTNNGGKAQWTINAMTFQSQYPKGFDFALDAKSSGGKITGAGVSFQFAPGYVSHVAAKIDASGKWSVHYPAQGIPQWVGVEYWWSLKDEAGNNFETPHKQDEYADNNHKWKRAESEDVIVFWQQGVPDDVGPITIKAMHEQRPVYLRNWGRLLNFKPRAILYADAATIEEVEPGMTVFAQGRTDIFWGATIQQYIPLGINLGSRYLAYQVVLHEVGHLYQALTGGSAQGVDWFIEGDATYFEISVTPTFDCVVTARDEAVQGDLPTLQGEGPTIRGRPRDAWRGGYAVGCAFFNWLAATYGPNAHLKLWTLIGKGMAREEALQQVTGLSFVDMDTAFRKWLGMKDPVAPTPMELPSMDFPPTPDYSQPSPTP